MTADVFQTRPASADEAAASYVDLLSELRPYVSVAEIATTAGVSRRQVTNWLSATHRPQGIARERILFLHYVVRHLEQVLSPEGIEIWLHRPSAPLGGSSPLRALQAGRYEALQTALEQTASPGRQVETSQVGAGGKPVRTEPDRWHGAPRAVPDDSVTGAIVRAKEGDADALHFLYVRFVDDVRGYIQSIVHDQHEADDITHNLFSKLLTKIQRYEQREVPFAAWILRVARNAALDHVRTRRAIPCDEVRTSDEHDDEAAIERSGALRAALETLPEVQREVLVLRHIAGLSAGEIAERLGKTESAIHGLHYRGRTALGAALRTGDPEAEDDPKEATC